jgi:hypothetical protein
MRRILDRLRAGATGRSRGQSRAYREVPARQASTLLRLMEAYG